MHLSGWMEGDLRTVQALYIIILKSRTKNNKRKSHPIKLVNQLSCKKYSYFANNWLRTRIYTYVKFSHDQIDICKNKHHKNELICLQLTVQCFNFIILSQSYLRLTSSDNTYYLQYNLVGLKVQQWAYTYLSIQFSKIKVSPSLPAFRRDWELKVTAWWICWGSSLPNIQKWSNVRFPASKHINCCNDWQFLM